MLSPSTKRHIYQIIPFVVIWLVFSLIYILLEKGLLGDLDYYPETGNPYDFHKNTIIILSTAFIFSIGIGIFEIFFLNKLFIRKSFGKKIFFKTLIYLAIMILIVLIKTLITNCIQLNTGIFDGQVWENTWNFTKDLSFWSIEFYVAAIIFISLFYSEVSDNLGQGVLNNFLSGRYHKPIEEERIFMFLDMNSSTSIAEKLGHIHYFEMLSAYYSDLADPIIQHAGRIYQYVGDQIVVSWKLNSGLYQNNCLHCFFAMRDTLAKNAEKYQTNFGFTPSFKAGFHIGKVTTGEIGKIKKQIIFTGDVLNTTARIQGLCSEYQVDILMSGRLKNRLKLKGQFVSTSLGKKELRGKHEKIELFNIRKKK